MGLFNSYANATVMGNITKDLEIKKVGGDTSVLEATIAVNDRVKKDGQYVDETAFIDFTAWGKTAELVHKFGSKGKVILVSGRLRQENWVDKQTGKARSKLKIVANEVTFVGRGDSDKQSEQAARGAAPKVSMEEEMNIPF